ncbi:MAG: ATP-binding cassette domain-containing protein, partial [Acidimicrobiaceae bacterium]|nr:ATP-binding cassette domain-containing protein [Acidimicrobiaceae bacterium]
MRGLLSNRVGSQLAGSAVLFAVLVLGGLAYASGGAPTRDILVTQMLINAIMVIGLQIYIGNTGVLSFGHMGFAAISGYAFALLATSVERKARIVPDVPLGLDGVSLNPVVAAAAAIVITVFVGLVVGLGLARSGAKSGAVAATVITLALLFMVHEVGGAYADLTGGRNGISFSVGRGLDSRLWVFLALIGAIVLARLFKSSRIGRMAQAAREDDLAARAMGINPARGQMVALLLSVAVISVAASLRVFQLGSVAPSTFFFDYTLLTLVMLIVGGRNSIAGSVLGVALMTVVNETTRHLADVEIDGGPADILDIVLRPGLTDIVLGSSMLGFMIFRARGLIEDWEVDHWLRKRLGRPEAMPAPLQDAPTPEPAQLSAVDITVDFGGFRALERAGLEASNLEVVGLIGPNGAGKTTLLNVVTGLVEGTEGSATLTEHSAGGPEARTITGSEPFEVARAGLARTFQNLRLFPALTVRENVNIAALVASRHRPGGDRPTVEQLLVHAGLWELRDRRARELDYGNARRLELVRAAALSP